MNALADIFLPLKEAHQEAVGLANCWRGRCVNLFAKGERIIGEALRKHDPDKPLPMLLSQRVAKLTALLSTDCKKTSALKAFAAEADQRNAIVHGDGKVFVDRYGQWLLTLHALDRSGSVSRQVAQAEGDQQLRNLKSVVDRLAALLRD